MLFLAIFVNRSRLGDPAESIRNTRRVSAVYLRGVAVARERYPIN